MYTEVSYFEDLLSEFLEQNALKDGL